MPPVEEKEAPRARSAKPETKSFYLKAGIHVGNDYSKKPTQRKLADGTVVDVYPRKTFRAGDTVESEGDLVASCGVEKFGYAGARGSSRKAQSLDAKIADLQKERRAVLQEQMTQDAEQAPPVESTILNPFPHGQVLEGYQGTTGGVSGMAHPDARKVVSGDKTTPASKRAPVPPPELTHPGITPETTRAARSAEGKTGVEEDSGGTGGGGTSGGEKSTGSHGTSTRGKGHGSAH